MSSDNDAIIKTIRDDLTDHETAIMNLNRRLTALEEHVKYWDTVTDNNIGQLKRDVHLLDRIKRDKP